MLAVLDSLIPHQIFLIHAPTVVTHSFSNSYFFADTVQRSTTFPAGLVACVALGFHAKLAALLLALALLIENIFFNPFWLLSHGYEFDLMQ